MQVTLTEKEIAALKYALDIAFGSYEGEDPESLDSDIVRDMMLWQKVEAKLGY